MKINTEYYLHKIDSALKDKSKKDIQMIYIMVVVGIFAFSYLLFWDSSFDRFEKTRNNVKNLQRKINADRQFLQRNPESIITKLNLEIQNLNNQITSIRKSNQYIKNKIDTISSLIYDERIWGEYLDSVTTNAQKYHIKLYDFTNKYTKDKKSFGHVLDISIASSGSYQNTLKYINALEQSDLVVDIHDFTMAARDKRLYTDLNISVWGITY